MSTTILPVVLVALTILAAAAGTLAYHGFAGVRARRRAAWELERAEWRRWIIRPS